MRILLFLTLVYSASCFGQNVKYEIGTSKWIKNGIIVINSSIDHKYSFDNQGREISEWKVNREPKDFKIIDTTILNIDSVGKHISQSANNETWFYFYNSLGTLIKIIIEGRKGFNTMTVTYAPIYDKKNKLLEKTQFYNGRAMDTIKYEYKGDTIIEKSKNYILHTLKSITGKTTYTKYINLASEDAHIDISTWEFNKKDRIIIYEKYTNGKRHKRTVHNYENGHRTFRTEELFLDEYKVVTTYEYIFW